MKEREIKEIQALDKVIKTAIQTVMLSKEQIFEIAESTRIEGDNLKRELDQIRIQVNEVINLHDELDSKYKRMRVRLMEVSRNFHRYSEEDIRNAYEQANAVQVELRLARERESYLRKRRDELELRLKNLEKTLQKAENLMSQFSVVLGYLQGDIARMTEALESAKQGQFFGLKIIQAQEEERKRVAREIHDGPAQLMANVVLRADIVEKILNQEKIDQAKEELKDLKKLVRNSLADVRRIIYDLRPMALDDLGLIPTLRKFVEDYTTRFGILIEFRTSGVEERLPVSMEVAIFRLIQEGLNNIVKHSQASQAFVGLEYKPLDLHVTIKDNGIGFDEENHQTENKFGLMGMRERVKLLQGEFQIVSMPGNGTEIFIRIPLTNKNEA